MIFSWLEKALTYRPDRKSYAPIDCYAFKRVELRHKGGESSDLYISRRSENAPFVMFSHGNTGNISFHTWYYDLFNRIGVSFAAYDYPGYGESHGTPSEPLLYESGELVYRHLIESENVPATSLVQFGLSLGASVSIELSKKYRMAGLIIEAPFTDSSDMGRHKFPRLRLDRLVSNKFKNSEKIAQCNCPLLVLHGAEDQTTPYEMGQKLFELHRGPKEILIVQGAGHTDVGVVGGERYDNLVRDFVFRVANK